MLQSQEPVDFGCTFIILTQATSTVTQDSRKIPQLHPKWCAYVQNFFPSKSQTLFISVIKARKLFYKTWSVKIVLILLFHFPFAYLQGYILFYFIFLTVSTPFFSEQYSKYCVHVLSSIYYSTANNRDIAYIFTCVCCAKIDILFDNMKLSWFKNYSMQPCL